MTNLAVRCIVALNFPIEAFLQAMQQKERNRQQAMLDAQGIGQNIGGVVEAFKKHKAQQQLLSAMQQPQQVPIQGPQQMGPLTPAQQTMAPGSMVQNPQADIMGPLQQLYPDAFGKQLIDKLMSSNQQDGMFSPETMQAAEEGDYPRIAQLSGGGISPKLLPFISQAKAREGQAETRSGVQRRFNESDADRDLTRQMRVDKGIADIGLRIDNHPVIKKLRDQEVSLGQVDELLGLVKSGNTTASAAMGIKMAKAMGEVGVMTEGDIRRYVESGKLTQAAGDRLSKWIKGTPSDATQTELAEMVNFMKGSMDRKIQPFLDRQVNIVSKNYGLSKEEAAERLDVPYTGITGKSVARSINGQSVLPKDKAFRLAELRAKKASGTLGK